MSIEKLDIGKLLYEAAGGDKLDCWLRGRIYKHFIDGDLIDYSYFYNPDKEPLSGEVTKENQNRYLKNILLEVFDTEEMAELYADKLLEQVLNNGIDQSEPINEFNIDIEHLMPYFLDRVVSLRVKKILNRRQYFVANFDSFVELIDSELSFSNSVEPKDLTNKKNGPLKGQIDKYASGLRSRIKNSRDFSIPPRKPKTFSISFLERAKKEYEHYYPVIKELKHSGYPRAVIKLTNKETKKLGLMENTEENEIIKGHYQGLVDDAYQIIKSALIFKGLEATRLTCYYILKSCNWPNLSEDNTDEITETLYRSLRLINKKQ